LPWLLEETSVFGQGPLIVADVADAARLAGVRAELGAAILVGVDEGARVPEVGDVFDILLTTASSPPCPWVQVQEMASAVADLRNAVAANPNAAVTLVQVLRAQRNAAFEAALQIESWAYSSLLAGGEFRRWRTATPRGDATPGMGPVLEIAREAETL